ncbi:MAG: OadG family protein [Proteobacteria bacterium]|nr:OadG family protein [Pseudomonadota bacterium]
MIQQGLVLMVAGMGMVFVFLTIMVLVMYGAAAVFRKYAGFFEPEKAVAVVPNKQPQATLPKAMSKQGAAADKSAEIAVAIAAVKAYIRK